jgi:tRNA pseudouridine32 synthase/23S rRNA pseudouridine746 synthase
VVQTNSFFIPFASDIQASALPGKFELMKHEPHPLCLLAAADLQQYLQHQEEWEHNFGLSLTDKGTIIGKMFGVLVVKTQESKIGYLAAFSGKLAGTNQHTKFVPPVFDLLGDNGFLNTGMKELSRINDEIKNNQETKPNGYEEKIHHLKTTRRKHSVALQKQIFDEYHFLNKAGEEKGLYELFTLTKNPPSGAGECAGPKLLQYAFQHNMQPLALAEFWWGQSPKSTHWKHGNFYTCCKEKCEPILAHMLIGID